MEPDRPPIGDLLDEATERLRAVDVADTAAALHAAWHGFCVAGAAGQLLAVRADPEEYPPLWQNARPVLATAIGALRTAPSLPAGALTQNRPAGWPHDRLDDATAAAIRQQILGLVPALSTVLAAAARHASAGADRKACRDATVLSSELGDCYEGRLRSFLNPYRAQFGPGSFRIRGHGSRMRRRG